MVIKMAPLEKDIVWSNGINGIYTDPMVYYEDSTDISRIEETKETKAIISIHFYPVETHWLSDKVIPNIAKVCWAVL